MKKIEAYIQTFRLSKVETALRLAHIHGMTVFDVKGFGKEKDESYPHHAEDFLVEFTPKTKLEIICKDAETDGIVRIIMETAKTGRRGDGKIVVSEIDEVISIRTGNKNDEAI